MSDLDAESVDVLRSIPELGYVEVGAGRLIAAALPPCNVWVHDRWQPTLQYLHSYAQHHPGWQGQFFVCLYDGWREYAAAVPEGERRYVSWREIDRSMFSGYGMANEPRFVQRHPDRRIWPVLPHPVLTYNRHIDDRAALLIPDSEFLATGFAPFLDQVREADIPFEQKRSKIVWRGSPLRVGNQDFYDLVPDSPRSRDLAVELSKTSPILDASYEPAPISWMLQHRYLLDLDGTVNAWSALYWKLSSRSVVFKLRSPWEQWFYDRLVPNETYIAIDDLRELEKHYRYCEANPGFCEQVSRRAREFAATLTPAYAIERYSIR
jgi:Glycosyl transferase family 90